MRYFLFIMRYFLSIIFLFFYISNVFADSQNTSGVTAQTIIDRVQYNINATSDALYTDAEMLEWVNQGIFDIASRSKCLQDSYEMNLTANTYKYDISGNTKYIEITDVVYVDANSVWTGLKKVTSMNLTQGIEDRPTFWYESNVGSNLIIFPTLSGVTGGPKVVVFYVTQPTAITLTAAIPLPAKFDQALIYYVMHKALERDRKDSTELYNKYLESIDNVINKEDKNNKK